MVLCMSPLCWGYLHHLVSMLYLVLNSICLCVTGFLAKAVSCVMGCSCASCASAHRDGHISTPCRGALWWERSCAAQCHTPHHASLIQHCWKPTGLVLSACARPLWRHECHAGCAVQLGVQLWRHHHSHGLFHQCVIPLLAALYFSSLCRITFFSGAVSIQQGWLWWSCLAKTHRALVV
ncbi:hypothetical protein COO60DRAFT_1475546 [Scenedesmus sp. NREL 46B-D3]|nr:hypothetical protein COO60DRAFT_1475546 [Scenedesmus sp. NREL 46B-D3]